MEAFCLQGGGGGGEGGAGGENVVYQEEVVDTGGLQLSGALGVEAESSLDVFCFFGAAQAGYSAVWDQASTSDPRYTAAKTDTTKRDATKATATK